MSFSKSWNCSSGKNSQVQRVVFIPWIKLCSVVYVCFTAFCLQNCWPSLGKYICVSPPAILFSLSIYSVLQNCVYMRYHFYLAWLIKICDNNGAVKVVHCVRFKFQDLFRILQWWLTSNLSVVAICTVQTTFAVQ